MHNVILLLITSEKVIYQEKYECKLKSNDNGKAMTNSIMSVHGLTSS